MGFDVEMAHILAREMGVELEFVPIERAKMAEQLDAGYCDLIMSGLAVTPERAQRMAFTRSYQTQTVAFIVKDYRRNEFNSRKAVQRLQQSQHLRIGVPNLAYYVDKVQRYLPEAELVKLNSVTEFFEQRGDALDALVFSAEGGSAWSLLYPAYTVAIPQPDVLAAPLAYAAARDSQELINFLNIWIELKEQERTLASLYDYWILGKNAVPQEPRWSVIRNILHWVE